MKYPLFEIIILSYARPQNMDRLLSEIIKINRPLIITVSNNNLNIDLTKYIQSDYLEKINLIQNKINLGAVERIFVAKKSIANHFVSIDDDVFMTAEQISSLMDYLLNDESVPHGCHEGQVLDCNVLRRIETNGRVNVLNSVYAFTKIHVDKFFQVSDSLKINLLSGNNPYEDIILSSCGISLPTCHDLGYIKKCSSCNNNEAISVKIHNFAQIRFNLFLKMRKLKLLPTVLI